MKSNQTLIAATPNSSGFDLTFCAPMSMSIAFAAGDTEEREHILAAWRDQVNEALHELEALLELPVQLETQTHRELDSGETFLHTHCFVSGVDVSNHEALFSWIGDQRRAINA